jgi:hypothetical protein
MPFGRDGIQRPPLDACFGVDRLALLRECGPHAQGPSDFLVVRFAQLCVAMDSNERNFFCPSGVIATKMLYVAPMNIRLLASRALKSSPIVLLAALAFSGSVAASAATPNSIEGVWSFSGGAVDIVPAPNGMLEGIVVGSTTTFGSCPHPQGETIWTEMQLQPDGSFTGLHQWYKGAGASCVKDPTLGHTAWRVLTNAAGEESLKVCFNTPTTATPPMIAADGKEANVNYGCQVSTALAPPQTVGGAGSPGSGPGAITFSNTVVLPPATACVSQKSLKIALNDPKYDPLTEVVVKIGSKKVVDVKGVKTIKKGITLKKLPSGTYKISVVATTILKQKLTGSQTYKSCTKGSGKIKLKRVKVKAHHA